MATSAMFYLYCLGIACYIATVNCAVTSVELGEDLLVDQTDPSQDVDSQCQAKLVDSKVNMEKLIGRVGNFINKVDNEIFKVWLNFWCQN